VTKIRLFLASTLIAFAPLHAYSLSTNTPSTQKVLDPRLAEFPKLYLVDHPLVHHKLTLARTKEVGPLVFRQLLSEIAVLLGYEITKTLPTKTVAIETPLVPMNAKKIHEKSIVIVPVLRAGLGMADGLHTLIPTADIAHIGLYRDSKTKKPVEYLFKIPPINNQTFIVVDPMLATGNSASYAVSRLIKAGVPADKILFMALVVAPEGMRVFQKAHPSVPVFAAALDDHLNDHAYIIPGLGDAGDRLYGTK
jgi:uracil phosphoribosyltransferase